MVRRSHGDRVVLTIDLPVTAAPTESRRMSCWRRRGTRAREVLAHWQYR